MLFSQSVALSILAALGANAMIIPNIGDVVDVFKNTDLSQFKEDVKEEAKNVGSTVSSAVADYESKLSSKLGPLLQNPRELIPHKYIVVFKNDVTPESVQFHQEWVAAKHSEHVAQADSSDPFFATISDANIEGGISDVFDIANLVTGYSGYFLQSTIDWIRRDPAVAFVEQDSVVRANEFEVQKGAPWGLARVSHRQPLSLNSFNQYLHDTEGGAGVTSYVIDTGVFVDHTQFEGRAKWGATIPSGDADVDGNGHGTHVAGTIASKDYGVAKKAKVVAVKVLRSNGSGSMSDVVKGVEFAAKSHQADVKAGKKGFKGSTANMSLGGGKSTALDLAVNAAVKAGLHFAVAAGNENQDAANTSPASAELAITVGASTISDARAYFSNYGETVDIFAPGLNIVSTYIGSDTATATLSGTSMASPHIAGLLTYFLSLQPGADSEFFVSEKGVSTAQLKKNLVSFGSKGLLSDIPDDGTPNILAFNGAGHNLTKFWGESVSEVSVEPVGKTSVLEGKLEDLMSKVETEAKEIVNDVMGFVDGVYKRE
ncbi:Subtilase family protein [Clavispora lusitaniae]|uniref:Cerevisin n=1 Tax=Clavispora lusitaniae TaxID=36911 RepID=A0AA91PW61_CLALS|nr:Subtilase family protein [Clavispora lusitaniae]OVF06614.1 putative proteinase B [Clavispora lusitaniae]